MLHYANQMQKEKMIDAENLWWTIFKETHGIPERFGLMDAISLFQQWFRQHRLRKALGYSLWNVVLVSIGNAKRLAQTPHFPASIEKEEEERVKKMKRIGSRVPYHTTHFMNVNNVIEEFGCAIFQDVIFHRVISSQGTQQLQWFFRYTYGTCVLLL